MNMTIDLEGIRAVLCRQIADELKATVTGAIHSQRQNGDLQEVTFDLWIERLGTRINRHLFLLLRPESMDMGQLNSLVKRYVKQFIRRDLVIQQGKDFLSKAGQN